MMLLSARLIIFLTLIFLPNTHSSFSDTTSGIFGLTENGLLAAFGDFNADKATDVFVLSDDAKSVQLILGKTEVIDASYSQQELIAASQTNDSYIVSMMPTDFNGDSMMDLLVTRRKNGVKSGPVEVLIYWGNIEHSTLDKDPLVLSDSFKDQPAIIDVNSDMIPDLLGEKENGERFYWIFSEEKNCTLTKVTNGTSKENLSSLYVPQSSAFLDYDGDLTADMIVVSTEDKLLQFEVWLNKKGTLQWNQTIKATDKLKVYGQPAFLDIDSDHTIDIVLPGCLDEKCQQSAIYVYSDNEWHKLDVNFNDGVNEWGFVTESSHPMLNIPISVKMGDINLDGYPDALGILSHSGKNTSHSVFVFKNVPCGDCEGYGRNFELSFKSLSKDFDTPFLVSFFDIGENGVLDVVMSVSDGGQKSQLKALSQTFTEDAYFMKVLVLSGLCKSDCEGGHQKYGVNQIGPAIKYETVNSEGDPQIGIASQLTQSAYFSLQLPFTVFGLGQTPNFVDSLEVGIPHPHGQKPRQKAFTTIIPNSRLVITPYPVNEPNSWSNKLFITPSRLVLLTGAALLGVCGFIAIIVGILHWRDRAEDKREKLQDSHKFHFDAM